MKKHATDLGFIVPQDSPEFVAAQCRVFYLIGQPFIKPVGSHLMHACIYADAAANDALLWLDTARQGACCMHVVLHFHACMHASGVYRQFFLRKGFIVSLLSEQG